MTGEEKLATAIVEQTCVDYYKACYKLESYKHKFRYKKDTIINAEYTKRNCIAFFKGDWVKVLMPNLDTTGLIEQLDIKVQNAVNKRLKKRERRLASRKTRAK